MARRAQFIPIEKATLVEMYRDQGLTLEEIGRNLGVSFRTVHRRMIEAGIPRRNMGSRPAHGDQPQRPAEILTPRFLTSTYQRQHMTVEQIAKQTGFCMDTVTFHLHPAVIPIRGVSYHISGTTLVKFKRPGSNHEADSGPLRLLGNHG
jgi:hypothetical protein